MKLGVPTLCRYDLLDGMLESAARGSVKPDGYIIIDNGGGYTKERASQKTGGVPVEFVQPEKNLGVAASWNRILEMAEGPVIISNDDIVFGPDTFGELAAALGYARFVSGDGWALFGQTPECTQLVGPYDENFWPAYYEDVDYHVRLLRAGIYPIRPLTTPVEHVGWATTRQLHDAAWLAEGRERNRQYMIQKWGSEHANALYREPFNGETPPDWQLRTSERGFTQATCMRWDVINHLAEKLNAERYLEIGVSDGSCMRRVKVPNRTGVDPEPHPGGVKASTWFTARTSDAFFEELEELGDHRSRFDLIFIDGDHRAEQVYREVKSALGFLRPHRGAIVLHDCNPHSEAMQAVPMMQSEWTGDVWKAVARLRSEGGLIIRVVNADYGIGIVLGTDRGCMPPPYADAPIDLGKPWQDLTWQDLVARRKELLGLLQPWEWKAWLKTLGL